MKFQAGLQGIDLDKEIKKKKEEESMLFRDPKDYEKMSSEKRKELTDKMMAKFYHFAQEQKVG